MPIPPIKSLSLHPPQQRFARESIVILPPPRRLRFKGEAFVTCRVFDECYSILSKMGRREIVGDMACGIYANMANRLIMSVKLCGEIGLAVPCKAMRDW